MEASVQQRVEAPGIETATGVYLMPKEETRRVAYAYVAVAEEFEGVNVKLLFACVREEAMELAEIINGVNTLDGEEKSVGVYSGEAMYLRAHKEQTEDNTMQLPFVAISVQRDEQANQPDMDAFEILVAREVEQSKEREKPQSSYIPPAKKQHFGARILQAFGRSG